MRAGTALLWSMLAALPLAAQGQDVHVEWEDRCAECHGHAGAFARQRLEVVDGVLVSDHWGADLGRFLASHHTTPATLGPITAMLTAQVNTPPVYAERCAGCHGPAAGLVRQSIVRRNGQPVIASSGLPLADALERHGRLEPGELDIVVQTLDRLIDETIAR
ncbi:MAG: hypothetical protein R3D28_23010 [Geminicoccaceae bacterium]